jgi:hypothetical protein
MSLARRVLLLAAAAAAALPACGETTYDTSIAPLPTSPGATATPTPPSTVAVTAETPLADLLTELRASMRSLDEQVVDNDGDDDTLARIDALWGFAEEKVYDERPGLLFGLQQAVALARSGVERRRPADASKGYLLVVPLVDQYLAE